MAAELLPLTRAHAQDFIRVMSAAFDRDPLFANLFPCTLPSREREHYKAQLLEYIFDKAFQRREKLAGIFRDGKVVACALWEGPDSSLTLRKLPQAAFQAAKLFSHLPFGTFFLLNRYMQEVQRYRPRFPHHALLMLGVDPVCSGQGLGRRLLRHVLESARQHPFSRGVALDTENRHNILFYGQEGFTLTHVSEVRGTSLYFLECAFPQRSPVHEGNKRTDTAGGVSTLSESGV